MTKLSHAFFAAVVAAFVSFSGPASVQAASMPAGIGSAVEDAGRLAVEEVRTPGRRVGGGRVGGGRIGGGRIGGGRYVGGGRRVVGGGRYVGGRRYVGGPRYGYRRYGYRPYVGVPVVVGYPRCVWRNRTVWSPAYGAYIVRRVRVCRY